MLAEDGLSALLQTSTMHNGIRYLFKDSFEYWDLKGVKGVYNRKKRKWLTRNLCRDYNR